MFSGISIELEVTRAVIYKRFQLIRLIVMISEKGGTGFILLKKKKHRRSTTLPVA